MSTDNGYINDALKALAELLDIPDSHHRLAEERYGDLGKWLHRKGSRVADFDPLVHPQGSFRYGTVIRPLLASDEYDLDPPAVPDDSSIPTLHVRRTDGSASTAIPSAWLAHDRRCNLEHCSSRPLDSSSGPALARILLANLSEQAKGRDRRCHL